MLLIIFRLKKQRKEQFTLNPKLKNLLISTHYVKLLQETSDLVTTLNLASLNLDLSDGLDTSKSKEKKEFFLKD